MSSNPTAPAPGTASAMPASATAPRVCGTCTLCCRLPEIEAFDKPADTFCRHCTEGIGCAIYPSRPQLCRDFLCLWITGAGDTTTAPLRLGPEWAPSRSHMMVYHQGPQLTVLVDPDYPDAFRGEPYASQLASFAEALDPEGYVIVFSGDSVTKIDAAPSSTPRGEEAISALSVS